MNSPDPDLYGQMLDAIRNWMSNYHPEADYAALVIELGSDLPSIQVTVIPSLSDA